MKSSSKFPKIGILGGGQLGKMLCEAAIPWHVPISILDKDKSFPAGPYATDWTNGDFKNYDDVLAFGEDLDVITVEIESINIDALKELVKRGKKVFPQPEVLEIIQDKGRQKQFYQRKEMPTAPFQIYDDYEKLEAGIRDGSISLPLVQKALRGGYDGRGTSILSDLKDLETKFLRVPSLIEPKVEIQKELSVIVSRNILGQIETFDTVEMIFHPEGNLVDDLLCPAEISPDESNTAQEIAKELIKALDMVGILAVEFFLDVNGNISINEVAPRPHNSGHHTINNTHCSQYEQHLRCLLDLPLIPGRSNNPAIMINLLGPAGSTGKPVYNGLSEILKVPGVFVYLYGKEESRPFRKLGHMVIVDNDLSQLREKANFVKQKMKITCE